MTDLRGKTFLVTGATSGIGAATCEGIAARGGRVLAVGRTQERVDALLARLPATSDPHRGFLADLSSVRECAELAERVSQTDSVEVLVNNVGAVFPERRISAEGVEMTLALNHLGPFVLTAGLLPAMRTCAAPRVVNVASQAHAETLDLSDLQGVGGYDGMHAYRQSKLLNILFTRELQRRNANWLITGCLHPGVVQTPLLGDYDRAQSIGTSTRGGRARGLLRRVRSRMRGTPTPSTGISAKDGAVTSLFVATSEHVLDRPGRYWREARAASPHPIAEDDATAARAWDVSQRLVDRLLG